MVALVRLPYPLRPDPFEVAEAFEVPLDFLIDPAICTRQPGMAGHDALLLRTPR